jgi:hypothetical protein
VQLALAPRALQVVPVQPVASLEQQAARVAPPYALQLTAAATKPRN